MRTTYAPCDAENNTICTKGPYCFLEGGEEAEYCCMSVSDDPDIGMWHNRMDQDAWEEKYHRKWINPDE